MLILASTSQSRRDLLTNAGLDFEIRAPGVDEDEVKLSLVARKADAAAIGQRVAYARSATAQDDDGRARGALQPLELDEQHVALLAADVDLDAAGRGAR